MSLGGSLAEARELYALLTDIEAKLKEIQTTSGTGNLGETSEKIRATHVHAFELFILTRRATASLRRLGMGENIDEWITYIQRVIFLMYTMNAAITALEALSGGWSVQLAVRGAIFAVSGLTQIMAWDDEADRRQSR